MSQKFHIYEYKRVAGLYMRKARALVSIGNLSSLFCYKSACPEFVDSTVSR